jgi:hypothetical protein
MSAMQLSGSLNMKARGHCWQFLVRGPFVGNASIEEIYAEPEFKQSRRDAEKNVSNSTPLRLPTLRSTFMQVINCWPVPKLLVTDAVEMIDCP